MEATGASPDWLGAFRQMAAAIGQMLDAHPATRERAVELGRGVGGDQTLVIDRDAETVIFNELERLAAAGHQFTAISEERGEVAFGGDSVWVVIDPIDGSLNAKRGLSPYAVSIAVADGTTMADVFVGFVHDFGSGEEWTAERGRGAQLNGRPLAPADSERRNANGRLELMAIESARPDWIAACAPALQPIAHRLRAYGSIACSLCQLAAGRVDAMATLASSRSVDAAAAQLIVRESGGCVAFTAYDEPLGQPLDLASRSPVIAARTQATLAELATLPSSV